MPRLRGRVGAALVVELLDFIAGEVARPGPLLVELAHHGSDQTLERLLRREHLHHPAAALYLALGTLLHVVRAQALPVRRRERQIGRRVGLGLLCDVGGPGAALAQHVAGHVVHGGRRGRILGAEDRRHDAPDAALELARARLAHAVAHQVHGASLPRRALEDFLYGLDQALVGVGGHEPHAVGAAVADGAQKPEPRVVGLRVDDRDPEHPAPALLVTADGGDHGGRADASAAPAFDVGGVQPQVRRAQSAQIPAEKLGDACVQVLRYRADLVLRQPGYAELLGDALHLARGRARRVHLGHRRHHGAVDALVALDDVLGEEAACAKLGYAQCDVADARDQVALPVAVAAVSAAGSGMLSARLSIAAFVLSFEPVMSAIPDSKAKALSLQSRLNLLRLHQLSRRDRARHPQHLGDVLAGHARPHERHGLRLQRRVVMAPGPSGPPLVRCVALVQPLVQRPAAGVPQLAHRARH